MDHPIWAPTEPSRFGERYFAYCPKIRKYLGVSSRLEHEQRLLLAYDIDVVSYCPQPVMAEATVEGLLRRSRPDFGVELKDGRRFYQEVKYKRDIDDPNSRAHLQIEIQKQWCVKNGFEHQVVTDKEIWANPTLNNSLRTLFQEYDFRFPVLFLEAEKAYNSILENIARWPGATISQIIAMRPAEFLVEVYRLAVMELLRCRRIDGRINSVPLTPRSQLFLPSAP